MSKKQGRQPGQAPPQRKKQRPRPAPPSVAPPPLPAPFAENAKWPLTAGVVLRGTWNVCILAPLTMWPFIGVMLRADAANIAIMHRGWLGGQWADLPHRCEARQGQRMATPADLMHPAP